MKSTKSVAILIVSGISILSFLSLAVASAIDRFFPSRPAPRETALLEERQFQAFITKKKELDAQKSAHAATSTHIALAESLGLYSSRTGIMQIPNVPFVPQSPLGEPGNWVLQNACEEASLLMAYGWIQGKEFSREEARSEILRLAEFENERLGFHEDTSIADTALIMEEYFGYHGARVRDGISAADILEELANGRIAILAVNGQILKNPNYLPPGPIQHMIVAIGYDFLRDEFIVHDPGTHAGENYRYSLATVQDALQDYPSGYHEPLEEGKRVMIVVYPPYETIGE